MKRNRAKELASLLFWIYITLMLLVVPRASEHKWCRLLAKTIAVLMIALVLTLLVWGAMLVGDYGDPLGFIPLSLAGVLSVGQIIAGILLHRRERRKNEHDAGEMK